METNRLVEGEPAKLTGNHGGDITVLSMSRIVSASRARGVERELAFRVMKRVEEGEPLYVVPMEVCQEDVERLAVRLAERVAQPAHPGAGVHYQVAGGAEIGGVTRGVAPPCGRPRDRPPTSIPWRHVSRAMKSSAIAVGRTSAPTVRGGGWC